MLVGGKERHEAYNFQGLYFGESVLESTQTWPKICLFQYFFVCLFRPTGRKTDQMTSYHPKLTLGV